MENEEFNPSEDIPTLKWQIEHMIMVVEAYRESGIGYEEQLKQAEKTLHELELQDSE